MFLVKNKSGEYKVLTGNQTGVLLTHYIISSLKDTGKLPANGAVIKTIVTSEMTRKITEDYDMKLIDVLTGFKYIGEKIKEFEETNSNTYLFGFEESYGCLAGTFVRDKDAVVAATLVCEMALYYKNKGLSLDDALNELYEKYGFYKEKLVSIELQGKEGQEKIQKALNYLRENMSDNVAGVKIVKKFDYKSSVEKDIPKNEEKKIELPKSNVLRFILEDGSWFVVRPSGTEPKMKVYLAVAGTNKEDSEARMNKFNNDVMDIINQACK
ncbi:phosphomannomutase [Clostridium acetobutylicum]|nr:phosphomannomutase [Clostridium acetobutylicum]